MIKINKDRILLLSTILSALFISVCAAYYSIVGLSKTFVGAYTEVMVMASSLEASKLIIASILQNYWKELNKALRTYLVAAIIVLILITSAGIYGFLTSAYQKTSRDLYSLNTKTEMLEERKNRFEKNKEDYLKERELILEDLSNLRSISSNTVNTRNSRNSYQVENRHVTKQISSLEERIEKVNQNIDVSNDSINSIESKILELKVGNEVSAEIGPLMYVSSLLGISLDRVINYFVLIIIFVFDPLAICLVLVANFLINRNKKEENSDMSRETKVLEEKKEEPMVYIDPPTEDSPIEETGVQEQEAPDVPNVEENREDVMIIGDGSEEEKELTLKNNLSEDLIEQINKTFSPKNIYREIRNTPHEELKNKK